MPHGVNLHVNAYSMVKYLLTLLVTLLFAVDGASQMFVWRNGSMVLALENCMADSITFVKPQDPLKNAQFSVSSTRKVRFSKGNLQYNDYDYEWRFAERQFSVVGADNEHIAEAYNGWIDLFGWGACGYDGHEVYSTSTDYNDYLVDGSLDNDLGLLDWGFAVGDEITNGEGLEWRTLSSEEWNYLLSQRPNARKKVGLATVCGRKGLIILADQWSTPDGLEFTSLEEGGMTYVNSLYEDKGMVVDHFEANVYGEEAWTMMENSGALFLPAAGRRWGTDHKNFGHADWGVYWSVTAAGVENRGNVRAVSFYQSGLTPLAETNRAYGASVRLVTDIE